MDTEITVQIWEDAGIFRYSIIQSVNDEPEVLAYGEADSEEVAIAFAKVAFAQVF